MREINYGNKRTLTIFIESMKVFFEISQIKFQQNQVRHIRAELKIFKLLR